MLAASLLKRAMGTQPCGLAWPRYVPNGLAAWALAESAAGPTVALIVSRHAYAWSTYACSAERLEMAHAVETSGDPPRTQKSASSDAAAPT